MTAQEIRQTFLDFFAEKKHQVVASAPIVAKDDPTLMFTNAGMNQFKDMFLGNQTPANPRITDTQKCLRVSGKHNDLEEVGRDSYHHTMFEMLGNWSVGDYFKKEAIDWAWELLTERYGLAKDRLYVSVFSGDEADGLPADEEAADLWRQYVSNDRILYFDRSDNFWEMGDTGPCGPCSEIHIDLRSDEQRAQTPGAELVNQDDPLVVEIWNLVFIQFNRLADGSLQELPAKHIDTGMGFERLCMALQKKTSNYDTDVFSPFIDKISRDSGIPYTGSYAPDAMTDIAMRVVSDHLRAVAFTIADGQIPDNTGAGYVIRRILRRAVRYYYSFLNIKEPYLHQLMPLLAEKFGDVFPEIRAQQQSVARIIEGEEKAFLATLEKGLKRFAGLSAQDGVISGQDAFVLYDTYGFPIDLTRLLAEEKGLDIDEAGFEQALTAQKERSRSATHRAVGDWTELADTDGVNFVGYDELIVTDARVTKYRTVALKKGQQYQIVLDTTPFYARSGGQAGDKGLLEIGDQTIKVVDTLKENELTIHIVDRLPEDLSGPVLASVHPEKRQATSSNHSAVHLMHAALHQILGDHALQRGQEVDHQRLRFDFSHFEKVSAEELEAIEVMVNDKIRANILLEENRNMPIEEAKASGATMLFGEKYGDTVRVITFDEDYSRELCGGTHVQATGEIGQFKILAESSVAAGVRRIEAITGEQAEAFLREELNTLAEVRAVFNNPKDLMKSLASLQDENKAFKKQIEQMLAQQAAGLKDQLLAGADTSKGYPVIAQVIPLGDATAVKNLAYQLEQQLGDAVVILGAEVKGKPQLTILISKALVEQHSLHAGNIIREAAKQIRGGGGGQPFFATAGGSDATGLANAVEQAVSSL